MKLSFLRKTLYVFLSAGLFVMALPPFRLGAMAWFAFLPLLLVLDDARSTGDGLFWGLFFGLVVNSIGFWWLIYPSGKGMIASIIYLSLFWALLGGLFGLFNSKRNGLGIVLFPALILFMEFARSFGRLGFPWHDIAYTQSYYLKIIQFADITGTAGVSLWVALLNVLLLKLVMHDISQLNIKGLVKRGTAIFLLFLLPLIYGNNRYKEFSGEGSELKVSVLQGNIDPYMKWDRGYRHVSMETYSDMIDSISSEALELVVMPESATAGYWRRKSTKFHMLEDRAHQYDMPILTGTLDYNPADRKEFYNSAYFINPFGQDEVYFKMQLVPVSEQIPWQEKYQWLRDIDVGGSHFTRGQEYKIFELPFGDGLSDTASFAVSICYESLFPDIVRRFRNEGAELLLNITNDGWFKNSPGAWQNLQFNVFRAIENRIFVARSANTGISGFFDPAGRLYRSIGLHKKGAVIGKVDLARNGRTFYTKHGNILGHLAFFLVPVLAIAGLFLKKEEHEK